MPDDYREITIPVPKPPSLNALYSGKHWSNRFGEKSSFGKQIKQTLHDFDRFSASKISIHLRYNCRFDVDNTIVAIKFLADYLKSHGYIVDDTPKYFTAISSEYDNSLGKNEFIATIKCWGYKIVEDDQEPAIKAVPPSRRRRTQSNDGAVRKSARRTRTSNSRKRTGGEDAPKVPSVRKRRTKRDT